MTLLAAPTSQDERPEEGVAANLTGGETLAGAAEALRAGRLVAFPTETVYGLGADATNDQAVAAIFEAKGRPHFNPLIVHIADRAEAPGLVAWTPLAEKLAEHFWPGPLTLILPRRTDSRISMLVSAGGDTLALRSPAHPVAEKLLREAKRPVAAPSANPAGRISPTTAAHVNQGLGDRIDLIVDGGACTVGVESTVIDLTAPTPCLLRPGGLPRQAIEDLLKARLATAGPLADPDSPLRSPGQLSSHYAPKHAVRLNVTDVKPGEALLAFGPKPLQGARCTLNLSPSGDLREAAGQLFAMLHDLDRRDIGGIAVMPIPSVGLGEAILDRLGRAAVDPSCRS